MSPLRAEDLTPAQRAALGLDGPAHRSRAGRKAHTAGALVCVRCGDRLVGPTAQRRHLEDTGHRRYALELTARGGDTHP